MDKPVTINEWKFLPGHFVCAASGAALTLNNYVVHDGDVYHKNHVPKVAPSGGVDSTTAHFMASQATASGAKTKGPGYTGQETSGNAHIPDHVAAAKEAGSGFSGTRLL